MRVYLKIQTEEQMKCLWVSDELRVVRHSLLKGRRDASEGTGPAVVKDSPGFGIASLC